MEIAVYLLISVVFSGIGAFLWSVWSSRRSKIDEISAKIDDLRDDLSFLGQKLTVISDAMDHGESVFSDFKSEMTDFMTLSAKSIKDLRDEVAEFRGNIFGGDSTESIPPIDFDSMSSSYENDVKSLVEQGYDRSYAEAKAAEVVLNKLASYGVRDSVAMVGDIVGGYE